MPKKMMIYKVINFFLRERENVFLTYITKSYVLLRKKKRKGHGTFLSSVTFFFLVYIITGE